MKSFLLSSACLLFIAYTGLAQQRCVSYEYQLQEIAERPSLQYRIQGTENFIKESLDKDRSIITYGTGPSGLSIIRIPVVVHVLFKNSEENITDQQVYSQIDILNKEFRKAHADTARIPLPFRNIAADCLFEFVLATITPQGYSTNGIIRKKTGSYAFGMDDKIKFSNSGGDDAWDSDKYLNIWVGNLTTGIIGYASILGGPKEKDGIVVRYTAFGNMGKVTAPYTLGRTAVHEAGHWLGLRHIWGDQFCGNDDVEDTPPQGTATRGCPEGVIISCNNGPFGNMYNNYMDLTSDECTNMFTIGQRDKMRAAFAFGGPRYLLLSSSGATGIPLPDPPIEDPAPEKTFSMYPNPANGFVTVDISKDQDFLGQVINIHNQLGQLLLQTRITKATMTINLQSLKEGIYFLKVGTKSKPFKLLKLPG